MNSAKNICYSLFICTIAIIAGMNTGENSEKVFADSFHNIAKENNEICQVPAHIPQELENAFNAATQNIPCYLLQSLERVEIFTDETKTLPRAMANARILKVRKDAIHDAEIVSVIIHELGHVVDLGGLVGTDYQNISEFHDGNLEFYNDDISLLFYQISWTPKSIRPDKTRLDFVGGYAKYDMFEDFSESFLLYINHGLYFKALAFQNEDIRKKYVFFKYFVFNKQEFETGTVPENLLTRNWDITRL